MSIADEKYKELIEDIHNNGIWDKNEDVRTVYDDGSPAYTKSIFGKQVVFEEGELPLLTTKHVGWKTAFKEMRLFWILQTVKKEDFENENVKVWNEWFLEDGTLGKSYAYQFESRPKKEIVKVKKKHKQHHGELSTVVIGEDLTPNYSNTDELIGKIFETNSGTKCIVIDTYPTGTHYEKSRSALIQFIDSKSTLTLQSGDVRNGNFRDRFERSVYGVGYLGNDYSIKYLSNEQNRLLKDIWYNILSRCYDTSSRRYTDYGGRGVFVDERWHCLEYFMKDIQKVQQWFLKLQNFKNYQLDKDYYLSNCYSVDTCVWLHNQENVLYTSNNGMPFCAYKDGNTIGKYISLRSCANDLFIDYSSIAKCLKNGKLAKGHTFSYISTSENEAYRYKLSSNQVVELLHNIKTNPMSRRLMTSFWNDADVKEKALQECAMQTTWNVRNGKLDLLLYSRSVDTGLGLPFNWIQYWFLLQLVAKATGLKAGRFIHQMGNAHYYCRHEELLLQQINSPTYEQPKFEFTTDNKEFFNFTLNDIAITDYQNGGKFEYEVAI